MREARVTLTKAPGRPSRSAEKIAAAQPPHAGKLNLDHVAHFVPDSFAATVEATEESIVNAMVAARDMTGADDHFVQAGFIVVDAAHGFLLGLVVGMPQRHAIAHRL